MIEQIGVRQLREMIVGGERLLLLDVRQPWEHDTARLPESVLIPLNELPERLDEIEPPAGAVVVCYCHHGVRSLSAAAILGDAGIRAVSLAGGIDAWSVAIDPDVPRY